MLYRLSPGERYIGQMGLRERFGLRSTKSLLLR